MGAFAHAVFLGAGQKEFLQNIALPTLKGLEKEGIVFKGVLYFGLMKTSDGLKVVSTTLVSATPKRRSCLRF
ncbi:MAG: hypothetical protein ACLTSK_00050 [Christensenellales bacterium]